jgi:hypothetical protein
MEKHVWIFYYYAGHDSRNLWNIQRDGKPNALETFLRYKDEGADLFPNLAEYDKHKHSAVTSIALTAFFVLISIGIHSKKNMIWFHTCAENMVNGC